MTERAFTIPEIMLVAGTRVALGVGIGLLISDRLKLDWATNRTRSPGSIRAMAQRNGWLFHIKSNPRYDSLRSDSRYADLVRRIGLP